MGDLAARMAARRARLEAAEESGEGMYFAGPNSGGVKNTNPVSASSKPTVSPAVASATSASTPVHGAPASLIIGDVQDVFSKDAHKMNGSVRAAKVSDVEPIIAEEDGEEEEEDGGLSAIAKYQEQLRSKDLHEQTTKYQEDLRNKDAADAVVGLACGNLDEVVASRTAPKSGLNGSQAPWSNQPISKPASVLGALHEEIIGMTQNHGPSIVYQPMSGDAPQSCTCSAGARELCAYCTMMNGPASNGSTTSYTPGSSAPQSLNSPLSMPNSHSSYVGMPSTRPSSHPKHGGLGPGWSEQTAPAGRPQEGTKGLKPAAGKQAQGEKVVKPKKKKSSGWLCCLRPKLDEDDAVPAQPGSWGSAGSGRGGSNGEVAADEIVRDGVPLGGVTSTSEDVIQIDSGTLVQCNVGLSVADDSDETDAHQTSPARVLAAAPLSSASVAGAPLSAGFDGIGKAYGGQGTSALTESNLSSLMPGSQGPRSRRAAPTSGTSLFSVAEHSTAVAVNAANIAAGRGGPMGGRAPAAAPISASLQELQGLDERRNMYLESLATREKGKQAAPVSSTLLELQDRQVVNNTVTTLQQNRPR